MKKIICLTIALFSIIGVTTINTDDNTRIDNSEYSSFVFNKVDDNKWDVLYCPNRTIEQHNLGCMTDEEVKNYFEKD